MSEASRPICIIDDDAAVRESLAWLLESVGFSANCYENAKDFLDGDSAGTCGCLILDVRLPGMSGLELQDLLCERGCDVPVIIITGHGDVPMAIRAMKAGAFDFVEKPFQDQTLLDRIGDAVRGDRHRRQLARHVETLRERRQTLSERETQVMNEVVKGRLNKEIANSLGLSHKTIEVHRSRVMDKMEASSLAELVRMSIDLERSATRV